MNERLHPEDDMAVALMRWVRLQSKRYPELARLYAIPNGGRRNVREAARFKRMGVRAGVLDYCLPVPNEGFHGLYLELKVKPNRPTKEQAAEVEQLRRDGYYAEVCYSWEEAAGILTAYLNA